jgi:hypothetical protein
MMRKVLIVAAALASLFGLVGGIAPAVSATAASQPYCGIRWGSLPKADLVYTYTTAPIVNLRAGRHPCFDRLVIDLGPQQPGLPPVSRYGYQLSYGPQPRNEDTGQLIPVTGGAFLSVVVNAAAHDENYNATYAPADRLRAVNVTGFRTFRQVAFLGTFEAQTEIVLGVRTRLPYRVFFLSGPGAGSRLVIDVAHRW